MIKKQDDVNNILGVITIAIVLAIGIGSGAETPLSASLPAPPQDVCQYVVKKGDTLSQMALRLTGKTDNYAEFKRHNNLIPEEIYPDDIVQIPRQLLLPQYQCPLGAQVSSPEMIEEPGATPQRANKKVFGDIEAFVFEDENGNGEHDAEEPGMPGIRVILVREGSAETSDEDGRVLFEQIELQDHAVGIDESTLPDGYRLCTKSSTFISLAEGDRGYVVFGMCVVSSSPEISD